MNLRPACGPHRPATASAAPPASDPVAAWRTALPVLAGSGFALRELDAADAPSLFAMISAEDASRFTSPAPTRMAGFEQLIEEARWERQIGRAVCFGIVPSGLPGAVGLIQVRFAFHHGVADWAFVLGAAFRGTGMFAQAAHLVVDFSFDVLGVHRLEARASVLNGRGNLALGKIGATQEGVLRRSVLHAGEYQDQVLWSIVADDWRLRPFAVSAPAH